MRRAVGAAALAATVALGGWGSGAPPSPSRVHLAGPPAGHTGGFGEPTCQACHAEYALNEPGGSLAVEGLPGAWEPGRSYALTVVLHSTEMAAAGFQMAVRFEDGTPAGRLVPIGPRTAVVDSTGVPYAQHAPFGTVPDTPETARWTVEWIAPGRGGPVRVHAAANSANGDNSPFGDLIYAVERGVRVRAGAGAGRVLPSTRGPPAGLRRTRSETQRSDCFSGTGRPSRRAGAICAPGVSSARLGVVPGAGVLRTKWRVRLGFGGCTVTR